MMFAAHSAQPVSACPGPNLPGTTGNVVYLGDNNDAVTGRQRVRELKLCTY